MDQDDGEQGGGSAPGAAPPPARRGAPCALLVVGAVCVLCLLPWAGLRALDRAWDREREATLEALAADGLPARPADVTVEGDPDAEQWLLAAGSRVDALPPAVGLMLGASLDHLRRGRADPRAAADLGVFEPDAGDPRCPADLAGAVTLSNAVAAELEAELDRRLARPWRLRYDAAGGFDVPLPALMPTKSLTNLFATRARWRALEGDLPGAWDDAARTLRLAARMDLPPLIGRLVRIACSGIALGALEDLFALAGPPDPARAAALEAQLALLDEGRGMTDAYRTELAMYEVGLDGPGGVDALAVGSNMPLPARVLARTQWSRWRLDLTARMAAAVRAARVGEDRPVEAVGALERLEGEVAADGTLLSQLLLPATSKAFLKDVRHRARVRLARAALRVPTGKGPDATPALLDPFDPAGAPLRRTDGADGRSRLWSVGHDGVDQGGAVRPDGTADDALGYDLVVEVAPGR